MNGDRIALDTTAAIDVLNNTGELREWIATFTLVSLPVPVVGELCFGAMNSQRAGKNRRRVDALIARCSVLDANLVTAEVCARIRFRLKQSGRPIPEHDVWIAALCIQHGLPLATSDEHFVLVEGLEVVKR
ncbi:MAG: type II toxin-antitoxin system VapC family toxin [Phycisphaerales bacterium]|nr:type II toxin-antitoxin system VapC family toxin [Phycisphaerales bacterium]